MRVEHIGTSPEVAGKHIAWEVAGTHKPGEAVDNRPQVVAAQSTELAYSIA